MTNFLIEITSEQIDTVILPTPINTIDKRFNIYYLDINNTPTDSYWTQWGGYYDNFVGVHQISLYYGEYLIRASSMNNLLTQPNSFFIENGIVYINISKHPWLFSDYSTSFERVVPFLSSALVPDNPSCNIINGDNAQVRLQTPSLNVRLSDNIAGVTLNQGFSVTLRNNDGYFDDENRMNIFNTPVFLKKSIKENPNYDDFKLIRTGLIENISSTLENVQINVSDRFRSLEEPVCKLVNPNDFGEIDIEERSLNRPIPLVYGTKRIRLIRFNDTSFLTAENANDVIDVFDRDGNSVKFTFDSSNKIITTYTPDDESPQQRAQEAIVVGDVNNKIGQVIKDIMSRTRIGYNDGNFNIYEFESYILKSPRVNFAITGGNIRRAVESVLRNDLAFFIQQSDGRFTIRRYGNTYATRNIPSWTITQNPTKSYDNAHNNYFSSCIINYNNTGDSYSSFLFNEREAEAEGRFRRRLQKTFDTDLIESDDAERLAVLLSDRYTNMRQTIRLAVGIDTSGFELMDRVICNISINDRNFSTNRAFFIKEINPAHDILVLEEIHLIDITGEYPHTTNFDYIVDNLFPETDRYDYTYIYDGGIH